MQAHEFLVAAAHKSSGKTTVCVGLVHALRGRGLSVQPFKKGPDYIDPLWLSSAAGKPCYNLDFNTQDDDEIGATFDRAVGDVRLVEGNKGLYDAVDVEGRYSNAALARLLGLRVILVIDASGITRGVAPLVTGYRDFEAIDIAGVILNQVAGSRHESKLRAAIERYTDIPVFGAIARDASLMIRERHLGLVPSNEHEDSARMVGVLGAAIERSVDLDAVIEATPAVSRREAPPRRARVNGAGIVLGVARDAAFGFYYPDDLEYLEAAGVTLAFFSPLSDARLPDCDALFIGGGFPESFAPVLAANAAMRASVREFASAGGIVHAECGGLMYLGRALECAGSVHEMTGVLPVVTGMQSRPAGRGLVRASATLHHPWARTGAVVNAHEFHYARQVEPCEPSAYAYDVIRGHGADGRHDGFVAGNVLATWLHQRHTRTNPWLDEFVAAISKSKRGVLHVDQVDRSGG